MKISIIIGLLITIFFVSCRKEDNPILPDLIRVPLPLITLDPSGDASVSAQDVAGFDGKIVVDLYFKNDVPPQKFDLVIIKNGDPSTVKKIKEGITSFPTTVNFTGAEILAAFGTAQEGDQFSIGADATSAGGQKFEAFPLTGTSYGASILGQPGSSPIVQLLVLCAFDKNSFNGNYTVTQDDWADFELGETVAVKPGAGDNQLSITAYPSPAFGTNRKAMIVDVDPATSIATVTEQVIGDYDGAPPGATIRGTGAVNPCGDRITLTLTFNIGGDEYTDNVLVLEK